MQRLLNGLAILQAVLGLRVVWRLVRTARGERIPVGTHVHDGSERVSVIVPVLNEQSRLGPCLAGLIAQPVAVVEILVVDGGSTDGTQGLVRRFAAEDDRIALLDASPVPVGRNGKAHGLRVGAERSQSDTPWLLTVDADVRPAPALVTSLLAQARRTGLSALSVATLQELSGPAEGLVHPALLTTLVYRFGIPGHAYTRVADVQANGQCFLLQREALDAVGGFGAVADSLCEDVTLARMLAAGGYRVGFYETDGLVSAAMYQGWLDAWRNWSRSLPMRDRFAGWATWLGLAEVTLVQALPLPLALLLCRRQQPAAIVSLVLVMVRLGTLAGMRRAYRRQPWTYWLSPLIDLPAAMQLWSSALRREHRWRGRPIIRGSG